MSSIKSGCSLSECFSNNQIKVNPKKCQSLMNVYRRAIIKIGEHSVSENCCEKLPIVKIASQLNFNIHLETIIKRPIHKVHVLVKIAPHMYI